MKNGKERSVFLNYKLTNLIWFWQPGPNASFSHKGLGKWLFSAWILYFIHSSEFRSCQSLDYTGSFCYRTPPMPVLLSHSRYLQWLIQCLSPPLDDTFWRKKFALCHVHLVSSIWQICINICWWLNKWVKRGGYCFYSGLTGDSSVEHRDSWKCKSELNIWAPQSQSSKTTEFPKHT